MREGRQISPQEEQKKADELRALAHKTISVDRKSWFEKSGAIEGNFKVWVHPQPRTSGTVRQISLSERLRLTWSSTFQDYCRRMKDPTFYGGEAELLALSGALQVFFLFVRVCLHAQACLGSVHGSAHMHPNPPKYQIMRIVSAVFPRVS